MAKQFVGPFKVSIDVHVRDEANPKQVGNVTVNLSPARFPTEGDIYNAIGQAIEGIPDTFRLMDADDFFNNVLLAEKYGKQRTKFATPSEFEYDPDEVTERAMAERAVRKSMKSEGGEEE